MHSVSGAWKEYSFQPRWRCCCERIWEGAGQWPLECPFQGRLTSDLAADVANDAAEPRAQDAQLPAVPVELLGVGVAPRHHRRLLGDAQVGLPQPNTVLPGHAVEALN